MKTVSRNRQSGAVSLFVVIFATLLITVVTVSFLRLMIKDQSQATNADLSQSAYDSAQAGVEDAKRALINYQQKCAALSASDCAILTTQMSSSVCNQALRIDNIVTDPSGEVAVQQTTNGTTDAKLAQAYTCVKLLLDTPEYLGNVSAYQSRLVPLYSGGVPFTSIKIEWFNTEDLGVNNAQKKLDLESVTTTQSLYQTTKWPDARPSVLRSQFMQVGSTFTLDQFDSNVDTNGVKTSNVNTLFLYPKSTVTPGPTPNFSDDTRRTSKLAAQAPMPALCKPDLTAGGYACSATINLPSPIMGSGRTAYIRVTPFYQATHFKITMLNGATVVPFRAVQPQIDSTGRANDLFRRVSTRVELVDASFPYPEAEIDTTGNLCKDFAVTDNPSDYKLYNAVECTP